MIPATPRPLALITGTCGGMGRAAARSFGRDHDLILTDITVEKLDNFADELREEGYIIPLALSGDLADEAFVKSLIQKTGSLKALIHTAGLSPAFADWKPILETNLVATERLLRAVEENDLLNDGGVAVLIASMAGHMASADPVADGLLASPLVDDFLSLIQPHIEALANPDDLYPLATPAYALSKREVIRLCERRAVTWGEKGARIVSISPGLIWTPMGRREVDINPQAAEVFAATPVGRWGTASDITNASRFLCSTAASFITGCDLRIDGGVTPAVLGTSF